MKKKFFAYFVSLLTISTLISVSLLSILPSYQKSQILTFLNPNQLYESYTFSMMNLSEGFGAGQMTGTQAGFYSFQSPDGYIFFAIFSTLVVSLGLFTMLAFYLHQRKQGVLASILP